MPRNRKSRRTRNNRRIRKSSDIYVDANGCLAERVSLGGQDVIVHYGDVPESDITTVDGLRCTTPLRTVIDIAPEIDAAQLERIVQDCLARKLFSISEALVRIAEPDMVNRRGAQLLRQALPN
jgi:hypothetical protein